MSDNIGPSWEDFSQINSSTPWWTRLWATIHGCEFAIIGIVSLSYLHKPLAPAAFYSTMAAIAALGIASAIIRKRE